MKLDIKEIEEIKSILYPHIGHLNFLIKIKKQDVDVLDIKNIIDYIKSKPHIIESLPKKLHSYNSYYKLINDIYYTEIDYELKRFIKSNLCKRSREIVLDTIDDDIIKEKMNDIIKNDALKESFLRWSSKINSKEYLRNYIELIVESGCDFKVESKSNIRRLTNYDIDRDYIPMEWCIRRRETFNNYTTSKDIFLLNKDGRIYGINLYKDTAKIISVIDQDNKAYVGDMKYFSDEIGKYLIFGTKDNENEVTVKKEQVSRISIFSKIKQILK